jgi:hypothetical protein
VTLRFTLDTVCVIAMAKAECNNPPEQVAAIERLIDMAADGSIDLQLAVAYDRDFERFRAPEGRRRQLEWLSAAPIATPRASGLFILGVSVIGGPDVIASDEDASLYSAVQAILDPHFDGAQLGDQPAWELAKRTSDADHLVAHNLSGADAFVTMDESTILVHGAALAQLGINVLWPTEAVAMVKATV